MATFKIRLIHAVVCVLAMRQAIAQSVTTPSKEPVRPFAEALRSHGIDPSEPSLVAALKNGDARVRSLAALQLAENRDLKAAPSIEAALAVEKDSQARIGIASALASIGDAVGARHLEAMCMDPSLPVYVTVGALQQLAATRLAQPGLASIGKCAEVVLSELERSTSSGDTLAALAALSAFPAMYRDAPRPLSDRMTADAQDLLQDKSPAVRMAASHTLAQIGSSALSSDSIRRALERESNPDVRSSFESDLQSLH